MSLSYEEKRVITEAIVTTESQGEVLTMPVWTTDDIQVSETGNVIQGLNDVTPGLVDDCKMSDEENESNELNESKGSDKENERVKESHRVPLAIKSVENVHINPNWLKGPQLSSHAKQKVSDNIKRNESSVIESIKPQDETPELIKTTIRELKREMIRVNETQEKMVTILETLSFSAEVLKYKRATSKTSLFSWKN